MDMLGAFNGKAVEAFPIVLSVAVVFSITDGQGEYELELSVEHDEAEATLGRATQRISLRKPTTYHDEAVALDLKLSRPGSFNVKLKANGDLIGQRAFVLVTA
jgi:hypothetical protein